MKRFVLVPAADAFGASCLMLAQESAAPEAKTEHKSEAGVIWKWANFVILAAGLGYLMKKHLPPMFRERTTEIQKDIARSAWRSKKTRKQRAASADARVRQALGAEMEHLVPWRNRKSKCSRKATASCQEPLARSRVTTHRLHRRSNPRAKSRGAN